MSTITHAVRACLRADRETIFVGAIASLTLIVATALLSHHGSFARTLAGLGLSPGS
jgi:hypothetical protein